MYARNVIVICLMMGSFSLFEEIPSFKGTYPCLSTICKWDHGIASIHRGKNQYQNAQPRRILALLCEYFDAFNFGCSHIREGRSWTFYWNLCNCCCLWDRRCPCSRWNGW
uniref:Secreted protein n=1 Tax=Rhizophora mucronata TaxID=61149 RepID=A0A2P2KM83_RHIMU